MGALVDLTGQKFGRLTVLCRDDEYHAPNGWHTPQWLCQCECGKKTVARGQYLKSGNTKSCGCIVKTRNGARTSPLHTTWSSMLTRCKNPNSKHFNRYGGRGIKICKEWENDFRSFESWALSNGWKKGLTIDRIDNDGDYTPSNCRIATQKEQCRNTRRNVWLEVDGQKMLLTDVAKKFNMWHHTIRYWMKKFGPEVAIQKAKERTNCVL